jgi:hypothetical protein
MATNVLVIPEDFRKDQYVLEPIVEAMFAALEVKAKVRVCTDPLLGGVGEATKWERIQEILERYKGMTRLFLLIVDQDCDKNRRAKLDGLEARANALLGAASTLLAVAAQHEVEVWVLAGLAEPPKGTSWREVREECHPKERFYDALAKSRGLLKAPFEGRQVLAREAATNYPRIRQLCPEDVGALEARVRAALGGAP